MKCADPVTPGEILLEEFLTPSGLSCDRLAREAGVPAQWIRNIIDGKRSVTADTDSRLCHFFGLSAGYWLRAQAAYDAEMTERRMSLSSEKIQSSSNYSTWQFPSAKAVAVMSKPYAN